MDLSSLLNTGSAATAVDGKLPLIHEARDSSDEELADSLRNPSATTSNSTAPSSIVATPQEKISSRRSSESRTPNRNRTPWDAGGYSLPLALDNTKKPVQPSGGRNIFVVTGAPLSKDITTPASTTSPESMDIVYSCGSPKGASPRHKFSDSRSSFSSAYTNASSTNNSVSHSRISSLSTVSENQPLANLITDFSLLETGVPDPSSGHLHHANQHQLKLHHYSFTTQVSPEKQGFQPESPTPVRSRHNLSLDDSREPSPRSPGRTQSPSDAMLIPRAEQPFCLSQVEEEYLPSTARLQLPPPRVRSQSRGSLLSSNSSPTRGHKRAASAPDFPSVSSSGFNPRFPTFGPIPEPTPSPSQHSEGNMMEHDSGSSLPSAHHTRSSDPNCSMATNSSISDFQSSNSHATSPPEARSTHHRSYPSVSSISERPNNSTQASPDAAVNFDVASICMYRGDCQTGSQLRKAISHIFGRNKLCTRMIPTGVWVHYCRKHYQRTRYRNGGEYPQRQIGLVQEQVNRVQAWSDFNAQQSHGPVLKDWSLSVRKREQMRLDSKAATGKKRPFQDDSVEDEEENFDDDRAEMRGTAVPDWVVARIGDGYSTTDILSIVDRLKSDIEQGRLQQIPDIEILPNIVTDSTNDEPASNNVVKKTYTKRRAASGHRRSQSVNTSALRSDSIPMARRSSQPNDFLTSASRALPMEHLQTPMEKRQRVDGDGTSYAHASNSVSEHLEGSQASSRYGFSSRLQLAHRPAFAGIRESQAEGQSYYYPDSNRYASNASDVYFRQRPTTESVYRAYEGERRYNDQGHLEQHGSETHRAHERHHSMSSSIPGGHSRSGVLPAPNPQRFSGQSVAQHLESSPYVLNSVAPRRSGTHQRSQSEAGFLHHMSSSHYGRPTSSGNHAHPPPFANQPQPATNSTNLSHTGFVEDEVSADGYASYPHQQRHHDHLKHDSEYLHRLGNQGGHADEGHRGSFSNQPAFGHAGDSGSQSYDKFDHVQLPPLQNIQSAVPSSGAPVSDRYLSVAPDYRGASRHSRHQSSPTVTRILPPPMEVNMEASPAMEK